MLDKKLYFNLVQALSENFGLEKTETQLKTYCQVTHPFMEKSGVTDAMFEEAVGKFIMKTQGNNFNKLPSVGDFLAILDLAPTDDTKELEKRATEQAQCVLSASSNYCQYYVFADPYTNYVIKTVYGGLGGVWKWSANNPEREESTWFVKDFVKHYMNAVDFNNFSTAEFAVSNPSPFWEGKKVIGEFTGEMPMLENKNNNEELAGVIGNIASNIKV